MDIIEQANESKRKTGVINNYLTDCKVINELLPKIFNDADKLSLIERDKIYDGLIHLSESAEMGLVALREIIKTMKETDAITKIET